MAKEEGWSTKAGSKWKTMPELMLRYRSATFFGRLYAPEILMGMHSADEVQDVQMMPSEPQQVDKEMERIVLMINDAATPEDLEMLEPIAMEHGQMELFNEKKAQITANAA